MRHVRRSRRASSKTRRSTPGAQTRKCADARSVRARGARKHAGRADARGAQARGARKHAGAQARVAAGRPVRPFSSRSGAPRSSRVGAAVAARPASVPRGTGRPPRPRTNAKHLSRGWGGLKVSVAPGCVLSCSFLKGARVSRVRKNRKRANTKQIRRKRNTHTDVSQTAKTCRKNRDQGGTDDSRRLSDERRCCPMNAVILENILDRSEASCGRRGRDPQYIFQGDGIENRKAEKASSGEKLLRKTPSGEELLQEKNFFRRRRASSGDELLQRKCSLSRRASSGEELLQRERFFKGTLLQERLSSATVERIGSLA